MRRRMTRHMAYVAAPAALFVASVLASIAAAQPIGDPAEGQRLAEAWCSECHATGRDSVYGITRAPGFAALAQRPATMTTSIPARTARTTMPTKGTSTSPTNTNIRIV